MLILCAMHGMRFCIKVKWNLLNISVNIELSSQFRSFKKCKILHFYLLHRSFIFNLCILACDIIWLLIGAMINRVSFIKGQNQLSMGGGGGCPPPPWTNFFSFLYIYFLNIYFKYKSEYTPPLIPCQLMRVRYMYMIHTSLKLKSLKKNNLISINMIL